jgi:hypothetical protein
MAPLRRAIFLSIDGGLILLAQAGHWLLHFPVSLVGQTLRVYVSQLYSHLTHLNPEDGGSMFF